MNEIKITTELCEADRKRLDTLAEAMGYLAGQIHLMLNGPAYELKQPDPTANLPEKEAPQPDPIADLPEEVKATEAPAAEEHPVEDETPFPEVTEEPKAEQPAVPAVTKDDVRKLFVKLAAAGKKEKAREIVTAYATSITELPDHLVSTVYLQLVELGG